MEKYRIRCSNWCRIIAVAMTVLIVQARGVPAAEGTGDYIHYRLGVKYKNEKKLERAIDEFRKVLAAYPDNYNAYFQMAQIRKMQKRPRLVIYNLKKSLSYNPGWSRAQKMLAVAYEQDGQLQKAIIELQQCQQAADPAERDSIQQQIDRLIGQVSGNQKTVKEGSGASSPEKSEAAGVAAAASVLKKKAVSTKRAATSTSRGKKPSSVDAAFKRAVELYNKEEFDKAITGFRQVLALHPNHPGAYYYAGLIRYRKKQHHMAKINLQKGLKWSELGFNGHYYLGKIYGEEKKYAQAITHLFKYMEKTTYEPGKKEAQELIEQYRRIAGSAVLDALAPGARKAATAADSLSPQERYLTLEVRIDSMLTMLTVDTLSDVGQQLLGGIHLFTDGKYDEAIKEFRKVLAKNPSGTVAVHCLYNTGICYLKLRLLKEAENQFQQVLDRYGRHSVAAKALFLKAVTYLERSEPATAEKLLRRFLRTYRDHLWAENGWEKLGDAYLDLEQPKKAVDAYQQSVNKCRKKADKVAVLFKLGKAYQDIGNSSKSIEAFQQAVSIGEKENVYLRVPDSYYRIGDQLYKSKDYKKALDYYTRAVRKYPAFQETPWGLFQIGSINRNLKRYRDAIDAFKELTRKFPDDYWARQAKWKLEDTIWEHEYKAVLR